MKPIYKSKFKFIIGLCLAVSMVLMVSCRPKTTTLSVQLPKEKILYPIWDSTYHIGYMNAQGETVIPCQYFAGSLFSNNRAFVRLDSNNLYPKWQMIDTKGNLLGEPIIFAPAFWPILYQGVFINNLSFFHVCGNTFLSYDSNICHPERYKDALEWSEMYIDTMGLVRYQHYPVSSKYNIETMIFYDSMCNSYRIKNKGLKYSHPFVSKYAILKLNQKSILIDTAQNRLANLPDSLGLIESVYGKYLVCITGDYDGWGDDKPIKGRYRVVVDTTGKYYCSFPFEKSYKLYNDKIIYTQKDSFVAYYNIVSAEHIVNPRKIKWHINPDLSSEWKYMHSPVLGSSFLGTYRQNGNFSLYDAHFNLIRSNIEVYNCIPMADLAFVRIEDRVGYMNEKGELVWSRSIIGKRRIKYLCPPITHLFRANFPYSFDSGCW